MKGQNPLYQLIDTYCAVKLMHEIVTTPSELNRQFLSKLEDSSDLEFSLISTIDVCRSVLVGFRVSDAQLELATRVKRVIDILRYMRRCAVINGTRGSIPADARELTDLASFTADTLAQGHAKRYWMEQTDTIRGLISEIEQFKEISDNDTWSEAIESIGVTLGTVAAGYALGPLALPLLGTVDEIADLDHDEDIAKGLRIANFLKTN
jgi:hypothetical protein